MINTTSQIGNKQYRTILYFDGVCNLCNRFVQWVLLADKKEQIYFATLQSASNLPIENQALKTVVLYHEGNYYYRSSAVLKLCSIIGGKWNLLKIGYILPGFFRDFIYDLVANRRYKWFGKSEQCLMPRPEWQKRFL